ncbi:unnamed protein product [Prunus armeniaca]|uniref:MHD1 domain-containing protein n=1 Tax=Prunus armeniaca TaxID=36596 RepID=A0A6J5TYJ7_PRUAR|nr:unnamed protein product [Prunus armeniaca]
MEEENAVELLQRYRRDRRILLDFILAGSLIKKVIMPPGAVTLDDVDLDQVSVDYVLNCAKKGGMLELSEAIRDYHDHTGLPQMVLLVNSFWLRILSFSGSPPKRAPPPVPDFVPPPVLTPPPGVFSSIPDLDSSPVASSVSKSESFNYTQAQELTVDDIEDFEDDDIDEADSLRISRRIRNDATDLSLGLSSFKTGITEDDLRETAYEVLLACAGAAGYTFIFGSDCAVKREKKDKRSKLMRKLGRSRNENPLSQSQRAPGLVGLLETMRVQMEISEAMDIRTRQGLLNALAGKVGKRMDALLVPLELLCCISRTEFSDKKAYIRWQKRQLNMLEEGLLNFPAVGFGESGRKASEFRILLAKIEESEFLPPSTGELQRTECLRSLREIATPLAERPARGDLTGEVCHWADGYHLNVRLYEKLLLSVFDMLDEGKLTEEVEEILELVKSTWRVLGITETMHYTCYAWVLFRQHVITSEQGVLKHAIEQLKKIPLKEQRGPQERLHLKSLHCRVEGDQGHQDLSFLQSFLLPIQKWADKQLGDYHLHFSEVPVVMENVVAVAMIAQRLLLEEPEAAMMQYTSSTDRDQIESYISSSIKNAFTRRHPQATSVSASLLHRLYGNKLKPFLGVAEHLTEDVISVFPAADNLEQYIMELITSNCGEETADIYCRKLAPYQIGSISGTLVMRWVNSQLGRILGWVERAVQQERWDPISPQQRHGSSIVEVFRIVEETVDQFFDLKVPMRPTELSGLFRGVDNAFQVFANHVIDKLATKEDLIPPVPILTRYKKEVGIKAFVKKELFDPRLPDERRSTEISVRTTPTLCVQLNTLYYAISQLNKLEDSMWERWTRKKPSQKFTRWFTPCCIRWRPITNFLFGRCKAIRRRLEVLKEFFISGGDGLPRGVVENQVARVRDVIKLHSYETRELIEDLKSSSGLGVQGGRSKLGADSKTLVRILCHRADSEASLFLKKQYKIPKSTA